MVQLSGSGLDDRIIQALERRAARSGRTVEAEHRSLLEEVLGPEIESVADAAAQLSVQSPPQTTDSADLLRATRKGRVDPAATPPSRFRKALGSAGPGETTDEIMQWLRPADSNVVERAIVLIENARVARTPAEESAVDAFLKEIGPA